MPTPDQAARIVEAHHQELLARRDQALRHLVGLISAARREAQRLRQIEHRMAAEGFDVEPATVAEAERACSDSEDAYLTWVWAVLGGTALLEAALKIDQEDPAEGRGRKDNEDEIVQ